MSRVIFVQAQTPNHPDAPALDCSDCCYSKLLVPASGVCTKEGWPNKQCKGGWAGCFKEVCV
jgi:hypothetical protein